MSKLTVWPGEYPPTGVRANISTGSDEQQQSGKHGQNVWMCWTSRGCYSFNSENNFFWWVILYELSEKANKLQEKQDQNSNQLSWLL